MADEHTQAVATIDTYRGALSRMEPQFAMALPKHIKPEKFYRVAVSALQNADPRNLAAADRHTVLSAIMRCAQDGLLMDGREAALTFYKLQDGGTVAQYLPMVRGIMKLARNSGEISKIVAQVVYQNDEFDIQFVADGPPILHKPNMRDRGEMIGVYALAYLKDHTWTDPEWMTCDQVNKIRARSRAQKGPWSTDYEQMALKTVIKRAAKRWPSSTDLDNMIHADDAEYERGPLVERIDEDTGEVVELSPSTSGKRASRTAGIIGSRNKNMPALPESEMAIDVPTRVAATDVKEDQRPDPTADFELSEPPPSGGA